MYTSYNRSHVSRRYYLSLIGLFVMLGVLLASKASTARGQESLKGHVDNLNGFSMQVPEEWAANSPSSEALFGATLIMNYDSVAWENEEITLPIDAIKVDIASAYIPPDTFATWVTQQLDDLIDTDSDSQQEAPELTPISLGDYSGVSYVVKWKGDGEWDTVLKIFLSVRTDKVLYAGIWPADSPSVNRVLAMLSTLQDIDGTPSSTPQDGASTLSSISRSSEENLLPDPLSDAIDSITTEEVESTCPGPAGTFPGNEAQPVPAILHMPFPPSDKGHTTYWRVGDHGNYFGNNYHCNGVDDYYATDWSLTYSNGVYRPDLGYRVQPVAQGTVIATVAVNTGSGGTGFGNYVLIEHNLGGSGTDYRTRYAHLQDVFVQPGQRVNHWDTIGTVGNTGNSTAEHLHLSVLQNVNGFYTSRCNTPTNGGNCPNYRPPLSPQTTRPDYFFWTGGVMRLVDGQWWQSMNQQYPSQEFQLRAVHSNKCADVSGVSYANGASIHQWDCLGTSQKNQLWKVYQVGDGHQFNLKAVHSGRCIDVAGVSIATGANIQQWDCAGPFSTNQLWRFIPIGGPDQFQIRAVHSNKCMDVSGPSWNNGANIHQWDCLGASQTNQLWIFNIP